MGKRVVHIEFPAQDIDRGKRFWEGVGVPGLQYLMFQDGDQGGAVYSMEGQSGTTVYLGSDDIDRIAMPWPRVVGLLLLGAGAALTLSKSG